MAREVPHQYVASLRAFLDPCLLDVHGQMHSRPSVCCQRQDHGSNCWKCRLATRCIEDDFTTIRNGEEFGWGLKSVVAKM